MALSWSKILQPEFIRESIQRQGFVLSLRRGLEVAFNRTYHAFFSSRLGRFVGSLINKSTKRERSLYAFYDFAKAANGFDFFNFLVLAESERIQKGYRGLHVVIVFPFEHQYKKYLDYKTLSVTDFYARLHNIVIPGVHLLPSCQRVTVCVNRNDAIGLFSAIDGNIFPEGYTVRAPLAYVRPSYIRAAVDSGQKVLNLQAPFLAAQAARSWIKQVAGMKKIVTITLRESTYAREKNSDLESWAAFAKGLQDTEDFIPVFIRDTEKAAESIPSVLGDFIICKEASMNLLFRAGVYQECYLNLFVNNGPAIVSILNYRSRYIIFKFMNAANKKATREFLRDNHGIDYGCSFPGAATWQKLVWKPDELEVINREFERMRKVIEQS